VKLEADGRVTIDISAPPSAELSQAIVAAGGTVVHESTTYSAVRAIVHRLRCRALRLAKK